MEQGRAVTDPRYSRELECPECGHGFAVELVSTIQVTRIPEAREALLGGTFNVFTCPACKAAAAVEAPLVYVDIARGHYVGMETAAGAADSRQAAIARHRTVFDEGFVNAPSLARELGRAVKRRVVIGLRALREKLVLWDDGLDDYAVEAVKGDLANELGMEPSEPLLRVARVLPGGHLLFARFAAGVVASGSHNESGDAFGTAVLPAAVNYHTAPAAHYQRRLQRRGAIAGDFPWLQDDWLVDIHDGPAYLYR